MTSQKLPPTPFGDDAPELTPTRLQRIPIAAAVSKEYELFSDFVVEFGKHLFPQGMFIPTPTPRPVGTLIRVSFKMREGFEILGATCEVVRADESLPGILSGMWVAFRVISDEQLALVRKLHAEHGQAS